MILTDWLIMHSISSKAADATNATSATDATVQKYQRCHNLEATRNAVNRKPNM